MLNFKIFKIPVRVEPVFWLGAFIIGGGIWAREREALLTTLFAMLAIFLSILVHELGHALTSRKLTGVLPSIQLVMLGGLARPNTHLTRQQSFRVTWAGPLAGLALFLTTVLGLTLLFGPASALAFTLPEILPGIRPRSVAVAIYASLNDYSYAFLSMILFANFWWSLLNLLPIFPLDGGQIYASLEESPVKIFRVGMITGIVAAMIFLVLGLLIGAFLFGFLAYQNYQRLQEIKAGSHFR